MRGPAGTKDAPHLNTPLALSPSLGGGCCQMRLCMHGEHAVEHPGLEPGTISALTRRVLQARRWPLEGCRHSSMPKLVHSRCSCLRRVKPERSS